MVGKRNVNACGIWVYYDRNHNLLEEPMYFDTHKEACMWLNRSYTFVYQMVCNGEAIEVKHASVTITRKAQAAGNSSQVHLDSVKAGIADCTGVQWSRQTMGQRYHKGNPNNMVVGAHHEPVEINGVVYKTHKEAALANHVSRQTIRNWIISGKAKRV